MSIETINRTVELSEDGMFHINLAALAVPNEGFSFDEFENSDDIGNEIKRIYELNNLDFTDKRVIELLIVSKDYRCNNVGDHGLLFNIDDDKPVVLSGSKFRYVPYQLIKNCREGDSFEYTVKIGIGDDPNFYDGEPDDESKKVLVRLHIKCAQQDYQYRRLGSFDTVVEKCKSRLNIVGRQC